ncbi:Protein NRT1/ PTR FAMILY 3.1 [Hibiscus syriacus]|uniref:Protein NRT1/ PTR FAMILY 3.1 n=1 Tax=Hibiscus syriacus TaxID=106335 RepID=A0A6A2Z884_HIBSY|nr:protein NRT1/ PTR FAMILY 3.1-like [Hibiscus syriacus]KAE8688191.1 Protein NRT1/ PTR FAMILY 3.1 [Hibiscus syriacus]
MENKDSFGASENGDDQSNKTLVDNNKGGIKTMPFIIINEICEKLAMVGFSKNMVNYLTNQLHMPLTKAANTVTNFNGTSSLTPLLGAFIADSYAGKFWTITVATAIYLMGMIVLTLSAAMPQLRPPPCEGNQVCQEANGSQTAILYLALMLAALGSGGIRPCVSAFGAEQFVEEDPRNPHKTWVFFNWYYFALGVAVLIALTVIVYIQDHVGWSFGLGIPTITMALSIIVFLIGYPLYRNLDPAGSPYTRVFQVCAAAFRKRKIPLISDPKFLYVNEVLDGSISSDGLLHHTNQFKFLDKAAIVTEEDGVASSEKPNFWRLNTVHRVEELKCIFRMLPIWGAGILFAAADAQQNTFSLQQGNTMDKHLSKSFEIPSASMSVFAKLSTLIVIVLYDRILVHVARRFTGLDRGINVLQRMGIGFFISILATLVAGFVEVKRKHAALADGLIDSPKSIIPISVFWLVPQYSLHGIAEAFTAIGHLEFFYDQAPESMRSTATALFWTSISAGDYTSTLLVTLVHKYTDWLPNKNLNKGKLEYFYWLITFLQALNFVYYLICSKFYTFKVFHSRKIERDEGVEVTSSV